MRAQVYVNPDARCLADGNDSELGPTSAMICCANPPRALALQTTSFKKPPNFDG